MEKDNSVNSPITPPLLPQVAPFDRNDPAYVFGRQMGEEWSARFFAHKGVNADAYPLTFGKTRPEE